MSARVAPPPVAKARRAKPRPAKAVVAKRAAPRARKAVLRRAKPKAPRRVAATLPAFAAQPTPVPVAAARVARPAAYALITTTVCEHAAPGAPRAYALLGGPPLPPPPVEVEGPPFIEGPDFPPDTPPDGPFYPPEIPPPTLGPPTIGPPGLPPIEPPVIPPEPPVVPVPEPGTWALLIVGFGLVGTFLRRGKRSLASGR